MSLREVQLELEQLERLGVFVNQRLEALTGKAWVRLPACEKLLEAHRLIASARIELIRDANERYRRAEREVARG